MLITYIIIIHDRIYYRLGYVHYTLIHSLSAHAFINVHKPLILMYSNIILFIIHYKSFVSVYYTLIIYYTHVKVQVTFIIMAYTQP